MATRNASRQAMSGALYLTDGYIPAMLTSLPIGGATPFLVFYSGSRQESHSATHTGLELTM